MTKKYTNIETINGENIEKIISTIQNNYSNKENLKVVEKTIMDDFARLKFITRWGSFKFTFKIEQNKIIGVDFLYGFYDEPMDGLALQTISFEEVAGLTEEINEREDYAKFATVSFFKLVKRFKEIKDSKNKNGVYTATTSKNNLLNQIIDNGGLDNFLKNNRARKIV